MARRFLKVFCDSLMDNWLSSLTDTEYATYWKINKLIHLNTSDGTAEFVFYSFAALIGKSRQNETVLKLLEKFHQDQRILWVNREEFVRKNLPVEVQEKLGIRPGSGASSEPGPGYSVNQWSKGGKIVEKIVLFSPKLLKYYDSSVYRKKRENDRDLDKREKTGNTSSVLQQNLSKTPCPHCGAPLTVKKSEYGEFASCSRFPDCKYKRDIQDDDWRDHRKEGSPIPPIAEKADDEQMTPEEKEKSNEARKKCMEKVKPFLKGFGGASEERRDRRK